MTAFDPAPVLAQLPLLPGVYQMRGAAGEWLYIGKARQLQRRVSSYFRANHPSAKTRRLVQLVAHIDITVTHTEAEALLLESQLIKRHQPRFNVLLRDNKGYPYLQLTAGDYPRLRFYRGSRQAPGRYFGPYPSAAAVRDTLEQLQKAFRLRLCDDTVFRHRSRPCLQHQLQRCSAACTQEISAADYAADVAAVVAFLEGQSRQVIDDRVARMTAAAAALEFETAARLRDQIAQLRRIQERQYVSREGQGEVDAVALALAAGTACVQVFAFREGQLLGNQAFFPQFPPEAEADEVLMGFLGQYYGAHPPPAQILLDRPLAELDWLAAALSTRRGAPVKLIHRLRGEHRPWVAMAQRNADLALQAKLASKASLTQRFGALQKVLDLATVPQRLECVDVSHTLGEAAVAACVVLTADGPLKADYRRYHLRDVTPGDDYAAIHQMLTRRFTRALNEQTALPDVLFIDGGRGQLHQAITVLAALGLERLPVVGIAKGPERIVGQEVLHRPEPLPPLTLGADHPALHLIQQVRDEAHRFALTGHRQRRAKARSESPLQAIAGIGPKRRQQLLQQFGGLQGLKRAGVEDLATVNGISRALAQRIYDALQGE